MGFYLQPDGLAMMINFRVVNLSFEQLNLKVCGAFSSLMG